MVADPVGSGFVQSLARPGANATGFTIMEPTIAGKWLELLKEIAPRVNRAAFLFNPATTPYADIYLNPFKAAATSFALEPIAAPVRGTSDLDSVVAAHAREPNGGLIVMPDGFLNVYRAEIISLVGGAAAWPLAARGQQAAKVVRLGYLAPARLSSLIEALRAGLRDFGYVEGQNLAIEYRFALGQTKSYDELAQELVSLDPAAIVLTGTPAALALKRQTTTIPIILAPIADPIALGLARSLARPGGNVTGVTMYGTALAHKRMEILREAAAGIRRVAVLVNAENPLHPFLWDDIQPIGPLLGLEF